MTISDLRRLRKPVSSKLHPLQSVQKIPHDHSHCRSSGEAGSGVKGEKVLRWRMVVVPKGQLWDSSVECRETYDRESFWGYCWEPI